MKAGKSTTRTPTTTSTQIVLGLPTEGYALSNGVRPVMSKPTFQQAAFTVSNGDKPVAPHIRC
jgi:uncharacterized protein (DUF2141 family)